MLKIFLILFDITAIIVGIVLCIIKFIDYLDENPYASKKVIEKVVYSTVAGHLIFLFIGVPFLQILFSLSIQYSYHCLFDSYPIIKPEDPRFIYGLVGSLINYFLMIRFVSIHTIGVFLLICSFTIVWITPVCFFFSMSATEETLFIKSKGRENKTYARIALDYISLYSKMAFEQVQTVIGSQTGTNNRND